MASNTLQQRITNGEQPPLNIPPIPTKPISTTITKQGANRASAQRALRSLAIGIAVPFFLSMTTIFIFGSGTKYQAMSKPFWFPPVWLIHVSYLGSSILMGLAAWLVWADGGFHLQSKSNSLFFYIAQISLSIIWSPVVLVFGVAWMGLLLCLVHFGTLMACYMSFRNVNPFAKDLVKPCLAWVGYLTIVNSTLVSTGI
ncbi:hypothetical protein ACLB2K_034849 [Fragaria x ananassa]|uniref:translocator protein homolog n=1 Tax=Fragaria vesca subsp. vesca TaxID=101020 RepID=UPI0005CAB45A|nr:PREDICTED: translocator protein homolog [Fragaria vesca subsp. vesca]